MEGNGLGTTYGWFLVWSCVDREGHWHTVLPKIRHPPGCTHVQLYADTTIERTVNGYSQPQTRLNQEKSNLRHIKPQTHQTTDNWTSDKEITDKMTQDTLKQRHNKTKTHQTPDSTKLWNIKHDTIEIYETLKGIQIQ